MSTPPVSVAKPSRHRIWILAACVLLAPAWPVVAQSDDDEWVSGLVARYTAGERSVDRIDRDVQFDWQAGSPDVRLPPGPFSVTWQGKLLVRGDGPHAFHLYLQGAATVELNGRTVVEGQRDTPGWVSGALVPIEGSEPTLRIFYRTNKPGTAPPGAQIRLFWSSETFPVEPIAPQLLFRAAPQPELDLVHRGAGLFAAHRCGACHRGTQDEPAASAPALSRHGVAVPARWLNDWLAAPSKVTPHARMPDLGLTSDEARLLAGWLVLPPAPAAPVPPPEGQSAAEAVRAGEVLFRSLGCLACHTHGTTGLATDFGGGDLTQVGRKRSAVWLERWLKEPAKLNADHRMPVFTLADDERRRLALFLAASGSIPGDPAPPAETEAQAAAAAKLLETARCAACHRIDGRETQVTGVPSLEQPVRDWSRACTEAGSDTSHRRPSYVLSADDRRAVRAFVEAYTGSRSVASATVRGGQLLRRKGCLNCHDRDGERGIAGLTASLARLDPALVGQSEALIPPHLSAVGDKLQDAALDQALRGQQPKVRLPWLRVRMPRFEHSAEDAAALRHYLVSHDRIPAAAPGVAAFASPDLAHLGELRKTGQTLAGTRGFSCTACHKIAGHEPRNVALATRGSDLYLIAQRMRPEFFRRWTRSPLRIVPGMEMPSFERPVSGILENRVDRQLDALWEGLNDSSAPPKIDTSTIEQTLFVSQGEPPKVVRDVFNIGTPLAPVFVPRALAVGLDNGFSALFDLDTLSLSGWWDGGLARQRAAGKSWYWEPARTVAAVKPQAPDVTLVREGGDAPPVTALSRDGRFGRLIRYAVVDSAQRPAQHSATGPGLEIEYELMFPVESMTATVGVVETWFPVRLPPVTVPPESATLVPPDHTAGTGQIRGDRRIVVRGIPRGYVARLQHSPQARDRHVSPIAVDAKGGVATFSRQYLGVAASPTPPLPGPAGQLEAINSVPGYDGARLPFPIGVMPTSLTFTASGTLAFCTLKGQVYLARDTDGDGIEDRLTLFEEGLAAPFGMIADGEDLIVAEKPDVLRLRDTDGDGRADVREVVASGWGCTEDYHDWTTGIVRDSQGNLYVGTGSDYAKAGRTSDQGKWRGKVLRIDKAGQVTPLGHAFRYPTGLAITPDDQIFVSDNQGVQNPFNEINHLVAGASYGVPSLFEENRDAPATLPAIQVPHPWTRSVNGLFFLPRAAGEAAHPFAGQGIGCEYDSRFLVRFSLQAVGNTFQGAVYPFSLPTPVGARDGFLGTLCGTVSPRGDIYIGSIYDSGWLGGPNIGDVVRLRPNGKLPVGLSEIRAAAGRFRLTFTAPVDRTSAARPDSYEIVGYTRKWQGAYATPDSGRHALAVERVVVADDGRSVELVTGDQQTGHVYEIHCGRIGPRTQPELWPAVGHYTFTAVPDRP